jgi:hypothetical protein
MTKDSKGIHMQCSGRISMDDFIVSAIEIGYLIQQHGCKKILLDFSSAKLDFAADDLINLLDIYAEYRVPLTTLSGIALSNGNTKHAFAKFLHTAKELGYSFDFLIGEKQGEAWLEAAK